MVFGQSDKQLLETLSTKSNETLQVELVLYRHGWLSIFPKLDFLSKRDQQYESRHDNLVDALK